MSLPGAVQELRGGRYAIVGTLGAGSQAETFDAVDKRDGTPVAIKRFQVRGAKSWKEVELAEREASVLSGLSHPNLPVYVEHFEEDGALYLVMRKIDGETLSTLRKRRAALSPEDIQRLLCDADSALSYLHSRAPPIIHRDLKPGNVIRRPDGSFAFVDFGSVRDRLKPEGGSTVVGTFGYMAPEQFQGRALPASDVYAVGATVLALITGREPEDLPHRGLALDVPRALDGAAAPWLERALCAMLEPDPDRRAPRIAPLLGERSQVPRGDHSASARALRESVRQYTRDQVERALDEASQAVVDARRARRDARREHREHRRERRRERRAGRSGARFPIAPLFLLGLAIARVATWLLFVIFLPTLLTLFGRRAGAERCRRIGATSDRGLSHAMAAVRGHVLRAAESELAQPTGAGQRYRVDSNRSPNTDRAADFPAEDPEEEARKRRL